MFLKVWETLSSLPLGPALTVLAPDSRPVVVPFPRLTLVMFHMSLRAGCVIVVPRDGVVDVVTECVSC